MEIPNTLVNKILNYLLRQADAGETEAEQLLDELNELIDTLRSKDAEILSDKC